MMWLRLAALAIGAAALSGAAPGDKKIELLGIPIGADLASAESMLAARGYSRQTRPNYCDNGRFCEAPITIENLPGTRFVSALHGWRDQPGKEESFNFHMTAPPNEARVWAAGLEQRFGDWFQPSAAAPLASDILTEIRTRYGPSTYESGNLTDPSNRGSSLSMVWVWDSNGGLYRYPDVSRLRWPKALLETRDNCQVAFAKAAVPPGKGTGGGTGNAAAINPEPFLLARKGNCALMMEAELSQTRGKLHRLYIRIVDFRAGHDALFHTTRLVSEERGKADAQRSRSNRPDF